MNKADRIAYVTAGLKSYALLNTSAKDRTSKTAWIALKVNCSQAHAVKSIAEAEVDVAARMTPAPHKDAKKP